MPSPSTPAHALRAALALLPERYPGAHPLTPYEFSALFTATGTSGEVWLCVYAVLRDSAFGPRAKGTPETRPTVEEWVERSTRSEQIDCLSRAVGLATEGGSRWVPQLQDMVGMLMGGAKALWHSAALLGSRSERR